MVCYWVWKIGWGGGLGHGFVLNFSDSRLPTPSSLGLGFVRFELPKPGSVVLGELGGDEMLILSNQLLSHLRDAQFKLIALNFTLGYFSLEDLIVGTVVPFFVNNLGRLWVRGVSCGTVFRRGIAIGIGIGIGSR